MILKINPYARRKYKQSTLMPIEITVRIIKNSNYNFESVLNSMRLQ